MKQKVTNKVRQYKQAYPIEYQACCDIVKEKRAALLNEETGNMKKGDHVMERHLLEYPEVLYNQIYNDLTPAEFVEFNSQEGQRWFAKQFPEFRVPKKI